MTGGDVMHSILVAKRNLLCEHAKHFSQLNEKDQLDDDEIHEIFPQLRNHM